MELTLWRDDATLARPVEAAGERHDVRPRLLLRVAHEGVTGYGEIGVQPARLNGDPSVDEVVEELRARLLVRVLDAAAREGSVPHWTRLARWVAARASSRFAIALVEMALLDHALRAASSSLELAWPPLFETPLMATVSLLDDSAWVVDPAAARLRVKTRPGDLSASGYERLGAAARPVLLDFNASATTPDEVLELVAKVARVATVVGVEQPFAPGNVVDHAALAARLDVALSLDEGVRDQGDLDRVARSRAATMVCVKPARVGGVANARALIARAGDHGLAVYLGGFFESAFARGVHRVLARATVSEPSDLGPVQRRDLAVPEAVATGDGLGVGPSAALLEHARALVTLR